MTISCIVALALAVAGEFGAKEGQVALITPTSRCSTYDSIVALVDQEPKWVAGLSDRMSILHHLGNLAASLCAKLLVPKPSEWLMAFHNDGAVVSAKHTW
jgi:hypothetical protein